MISIIESNIDALNAISSEPEKKVGVPGNAIYKLFGNEKKLDEIRRKRVNKTISDMHSTKKYRTIIRNNKPVEQMWYGSVGDDNYYRDVTQREKDAALTDYKLDAIDNLDRKTSSVLNFLKMFQRK